MKVHVTCRFDIDVQADDATALDAAHQRITHMLADGRITYRTFDYMTDDGISDRFYVDHENEQIHRMRIPTAKPYEIVDTAYDYDAIEQATAEPVPSASRSVYKHGKGAYDAARLRWALAPLRGLTLQRMKDLVHNERAAAARFTADMTNGDSE